MGVNQYQNPLGSLSAPGYAASGSNPCRSNGLLSPVHAYEAQKFISRLFLALEAAQDAARHSRAAGFLHASHHHAQMTRLHDHRHTLGLQDLKNGIGNLLGQPLLDLESPGKHVGNPG